MALGGDGVPKDGYTEYTVGVNKMSSGRSLTITDDDSLFVAVTKVMANGSADVVTLSEGQLTSAVQTVTFQLGEYAALQKIAIRLYQLNTRMEYVVVDQLEVPLVKDGMPGPIGKPGRMLYPAGLFDNTKSYVATDSAAPMVLMESGAVKAYYYMDKTVEWPAGSPSPSEDYSANGQNATWKPMTNFQALYAEILMTAFGKIASAVFSGDFMFSQYGLDANDQPSSDYQTFDGDPAPYIGNQFAPNFCVNFLTGEVWMRNAHVYGNVDAGSVTTHYKYLTEQGVATKVSDYEYTLNKDLDIIVNVGSIGKTTIINLPNGIEYVGKHAYIMDYGVGPYTRAGWPVIKITAPNGILGEGENSTIGDGSGYSSFTFTGGVVHLIGLRDTISGKCKWGLVSRTTVFFDYVK